MKKALRFLYKCGRINSVVIPGVAQLVARLTGGQEAVSSSLATRTKKTVDKSRRSFFVLFQKENHQVNWWFSFGSVNWRELICSILLCGENFAYLHLASGSLSKYL